MPSRQNTLFKIKRTSKWNGITILVVAILSLILSFLDYHFTGILISLFVAFSGWMEIQGSRQVDENLPLAGKWLTGSQIWLLTVVWTYTIIQWITFNPETVLEMVSPSLIHQLNVLGITGENVLQELLTKVVVSTYMAVLLVTLLYQGGLALFYWRKVRLLTSENPD